MIHKNTPSLWKDLIPQPSAQSHKYDRGVACVYGAPKLTGASRLAAAACARVGAGMVQVIAPDGTGDIYKVCLPAHILVQDDLHYNDARVTARLYGPGGLAKGVKIRLDRPCVLDAQGILARPEVLHENVVLTPHEGEFARAFPDITDSREARALAAAKQSGAVVVLKGGKSVVAHPDGRCAVNEHASPYLASAGTGDVLAGMVVGFLAQGMPAFEAACAACWLHGDAALRFGPGLVATDLPDMIPLSLKETLGIF